jgi:hypothetical protein
MRIRLFSTEIRGVIYRDMYSQLCSPSNCRFGGGGGGGDDREARRVIA